MAERNLDLLLAEKGLRLADLARRCRVDKSTATRWADKGIPLIRVPEVERETGIPREKLRPDFAWGIQQ